MLDDAAFYAANSLVTDRFLLTTGFNLHFTKPVRDRPGHCRRAWISGRRRVFVAEARLMDEEGDEIGRGTGTFMRSHIALSGLAGYRRLADRMVDDRIPAHLEVSGLIRAVEAAGGFAMVLSKGERDRRDLDRNMLKSRQFSAGLRADAAARRHPQMDACAKEQDTEKPVEFSEYLPAPRQQDPDLWVVELDIENAERFIDVAPRKLTLVSICTIWRARLSDSAGCYGIGNPAVVFSAQTGGRPAGHLRTDRGTIRR